MSKNVTKQVPSVLNGSRRNALKIVGGGFLASGIGTSSYANSEFDRMPANVAKPQITPLPINQKIEIISPTLLQERAKKVMTPGAYAFVSGGTGDEWTLNENHRAFNDYSIRTHRLQGIAATDIDTSINLLGHNLRSPILVAPMGLHYMAHPEGETATVAGVSAAGFLYESSGASYKSLEEIAKATSSPKWFQLYFNKDIDVTRNLLERAKASGYSAIIITADALGPGTSDGYKVLGKPTPPGTKFGNHDPRFGGKGNFLNQKVELTPDDIGYVISVTGLPVIVKGLMRPEDVDVAIRAGASAIQVSNHGGRQIDGVPGSISVLPGIVKAANDRVPVIFDSGIRRGIDVFRALALGAHAVAVGRPVLYGLALGGPSGVQSVLENLQEELKLAMLLAGARRVAELNPSFINLPMQNSQT